MPLQTVFASITATYLIHDSWSETWAGLRRLAFEILPEHQHQTLPEDGPLCKLVVVGANHLMEVALYRALLPHVREENLKDATYFEMLKLLGDIAHSLDLTKEPFASTERLRRRRNETIHKHSALADVEMARSAAYSAVSGSVAVFDAAGTPFPYKKHLEKRPIVAARWFSDVRYPGKN